MSENWQIALFSGILMLMTSILGYMANILSGIRKDLNAKVSKEDCCRNLDHQCARLTELEHDVKQNSIDIAGLKAGQREAL